MNKVELSESLKKGIDYIGVTVCFFCHDGNGRFVMAKRSSKARDEHGHWDIGGGAVDFGDTVEATLEKEIMEEYCAKIIDKKELGFSDVQRIHEGEPTHWVGLDFAVLVDPSTVAIGEPHKFDDLRWFTLDSLPPLEELHTALPNFLEKYNKVLRTL